MDVLTDILRTLRVRKSTGGSLELGAPWALRAPATDAGCVHVVSRGGCGLRVDDRTVRLDPGAVVLLPRGDAHVLANAPSDEPRSFAELFGSPASYGASAGVAPLRGGGRGATTEIVCARFRFSAVDRHPLLALLPPVVVVQDMECAGWMRRSLEFVAPGAASSEFGAQSAIDRVVELLLIQVIRAFVRTQPSAETSWLGALLDAQVGRALQHLHERPEHPWTLAELSRSVGMSRSGLAQRFAELVGTPPLQYLRGWRMHLAAQRFRSDASSTVSEVARAVGYESDAAFGVAFKKHFGLAPGRWRRSHLSLDRQDRDRGGRIPERIDGSTP